MTSSEQKETVKYFITTVLLLAVTLSLIWFQPPFRKEEICRYLPNVYRKISNIPVVGPYYVKLSTYMSQGISTITAFLRYKKLLIPSYSVNEKCGIETTSGTYYLALVPCTPAVRNEEITLLQKYNTLGSYIYFQAPKNQDEYRKLYNLPGDVQVGYVWLYIPQPNLKEKNMNFLIITELRLPIFIPENDNIAKKIF